MEAGSIYYILCINTVKNIGHTLLSKMLMRLGSGSMWTVYSTTIKNGDIAFLIEFIYDISLQEIRLSTMTVLFL